MCKTSRIKVCFRAQGEPVKVLRGRVAVNFAPRSLYQAGELCYNRSWTADIWQHFHGRISGMMIRIRFATPDDAAQLIEMNREFNGVEGLDMETVRAELAQGRELVVVADAGEQLAGYCCVQHYKSFCYPKGIAELTELYVREEFRHKGLASRMIACQVDALRPLGVDELEVIASADNRTGHAVYRANGFKEQAWTCMARKI